MRVEFIGGGALCTGRGGWLGDGVDVESPGGGENGSVRSSRGVNNSEAEGVGEVMCANVADKSWV